MFAGFYAFYVIASFILLAVDLLAGTLGNFYGEAVILEENNFGCHVLKLWCWFFFFEKILRRFYIVY